MTKLTAFRVLREHQGDKITDDGVVVHFYEEGETRLAVASDVATLIDTLLEPIDVEQEDEAVAEKSDAAPANKAESEPKNKAEPKPAPKTSGVKPKSE